VAAIRNTSPWPSPGVRLQKQGAAGIYEPMIVESHLPAAVRYDRLEGHNCGLLFVVRSGGMDAV
jgi:hypothetical protein